MCTHWNCTFGQKFQDFRCDDEYSFGRPDFLSKPIPEFFSGIGLVCDVIVCVNEHCFQTPGTMKKKVQTNTLKGILVVTYR